MWMILDWFEPKWPFLNEVMYNIVLFFSWWEIALSKLTFQIDVTIRDFIRFHFWCHILRRVRMLFRSIPNLQIWKSFDPFRKVRFFRKTGKTTKIAKNLLFLKGRENMKIKVGTINRKRKLARRRKRAQIQNLMKSRWERSMTRFFKLLVLVMFTIFRKIMKNFFQNFKTSIW